MAGMTLPGTYIDVRAEGLISPGQVTVGNLGVVGTAAKGPIGIPQLLGSMADAVRIFYGYDSWIDPGTLAPRTDALTLTRALELVFGFGGSTVYAVRVAAAGAAKGTASVASATGTVALTAKTEGTWGNDLGVNVATATDDAYVHESGSATASPALLHKPKPSARTRVTYHTGTTSHALDVFFDVATSAAGQVSINTTTKALTFNPTPASGDTFDVSYVVAAADAALVTLQLGHLQETYTVVSNKDLKAQLSASAWVDAGAVTAPDEVPTIPTPPPNQPPVFASFTGGTNGATSADYNAGLTALLNQPAHIIVGAGQDDSFGHKLDAHCQKASTDEIKHDRIGIVGSKPIKPTAVDTWFDAIIGHSLDSDRIIYVAPGIRATDTPTGDEVTLPGAYTAAAFAGLLSSFSPQVSPTNKTLPVDELETHFDSAHLKALLQNRVLAIESRQGFRVVRGITTTTGSAFAQITTRRIVDYAKFGVRSAANPFIGLLNNERVRGALRASISMFLANMVDDEMLESYEVSVTATRPQEIQGIVDVTLVLRPVFSIDFIKVTMFLQ